jgi:hypothetical protein
VEGEELLIGETSGFGMEYAGGNRKQRKRETVRVED